MNRIPRNNLEYSQRMLDIIMTRRRLYFNPYTVSDSRLLELIRSVRWGCEYDLTQMVILHFTRLRPVSDNRRFDGIFMRVGDSEEEVFLSSYAIRRGVTAYDTLRQETTKLGKRSILHDEQIEKLVGKTVFVSHTIRGRITLDTSGMAYKMHRLTGNIGHDAAVIRRSMCEAKIEMLTRLREHPECAIYLDCAPDLFDFKSRINRAIDRVNHFHEATPRDI